MVIKRPGIAKAALQTALSLGHPLPPEPFKRSNVKFRQVKPS